jgi:hypothetical protein
MTLTVGSITFEPDSFFDVFVDVAGNNDKLNVLGTLTVALGDQLNLTLDPGFVPVESFFDVLDWADGSNDFIPILPAVPTGFSWDTSQFASQGIIHLVPEPATWVLLLIGGLCLIYRRFRSK